MRGARGVIEVSGPDGSVRAATFTCCHCNGIHLEPAPGAPEVGFCTRCFARECVPCAKRLNGRCTPFEKRLAAYEQRQRLLIAVG